MLTLVHSSENQKIQTILKTRFQKLEDVFQREINSVLKDPSIKEDFSFSQSFGKRSKADSKDMNGPNSKERRKKQELPLEFDVKHRIGIKNQFLASHDFEIFRHFSIYQKL